MHQKFDCAIAVQLLCILQVDEKQILRNLHDLCISMVNRHIPPDDAVQMQCKRGANSPGKHSLHLLLPAIGKYGPTKYNWRRIIRGGLDMIVISFWQKYSVRPIHVFGGPGLLLSASGIVAGGWMGIQRLFFGGSLANRPMFLLAILMIIIGVQFVVSGILADIMPKVYYGQNGRKNYLVERVV